MITQKTLLITTVTTITIRSASSIASNNKSLANISNKPNPSNHSEHSGLDNFLKSNEPLNMEEMEAACASIDKTSESKPLEVKGIKRIRDADTSSDSDVSAHIDKKIRLEKDKVSTSNNGEQDIAYVPNSSSNKTSEWVANTTQVTEAPENPIIPLDYIQEPAGLGPININSTQIMINKHKELKDEAENTIDDFQVTAELIEGCTSEGIILRIREKINSFFSEQIDFDDTFDSDSEENHFADLGQDKQTGVLEPNLPPMSQDGSTESSVSKSMSSMSNLPEATYPNLNPVYTGIVSTDAVDNPTAPVVNTTVPVVNPTAPVVNTTGIPVNQEITSNPELTVHHPAAPEDDVLSINISSDVTDPHLGAGLVPLDNGQLADQVTYSELWRQDQYDPSNYLIHIQGIDNMNFRRAYEYVIDALNNMDMLIIKHNAMTALERTLAEAGVEVTNQSHDILLRGSELFEFISTFN